MVKIKIEMKSFLKKNKIFLAIVVGVAIVGVAIYFSGREEKPPKSR